MKAYHPCFVLNKERVMNKETIKGFKTILDGELDNVSEQEFYMKGSIDGIKKTET